MRFLIFLLVLMRLITVDIPDCRPEFITAFEKMANEGTKFAQGENKIQIHTPLIDLTKAQIITKGIQLGVDYSMTHSCYDPSESGLSCRTVRCLHSKKGWIRSCQYN
jgi:7-cyano-7-deazaguanine synthase